MVFPIAGGNESKGYEISNSLRFNDGDSPRLTKTPSGAGNKRTWTFSAWVKKCMPLTGGNQRLIACGSGTGVKFSSIEFDSSDRIRILEGTESGSATTVVNGVGNNRDPSAWYHVVVKYDSTQGTAADRIEIYLNGVEVTYSSTTYPAQNYDSEFNNTVVHTIGASSIGGSVASFLDGYMTEVHLVDGAAKAPTDFGEFDEDSPTIWKPKDVSDLTFGTNGFHLNYETAAELGTDANGGTALSETNLTALNQSTDTCTNNFTIWNGLTPRRSDITLTEGNLNVTMGGTSRGIFATIGVSSGKWYYEAKWVSGSYFQTGVVATDTMNDNDDVYGGKTGAFMYKQDGNIRSGGSTLASVSSLSTGDIVGVALDMDNDRVYFYKNGAIQNSGTGFDISAYSEYTFGCAPTSTTLSGNFGSPSFAISSGNADGNGYGNFEYAVPSNYFSLNTKNLSEFG